MRKLPKRKEYKIQRIIFKNNETMEELGMTYRGIYTNGLVNFYNIRLG